jgi:steroid 5-alpha reductase family enzyme
MLRTILFLIGTLIALPVIAWHYDSQLNTEQWTVLMALAQGALVAALLCFAVSTLSKNYSQVDKLWSLLPIGYTWYVAWSAGMSPRLVLMAVLATLWGLRLTYNFARRGGYHLLFWKGDEDYRWGVLRQQGKFKNPWIWALFNLFFISLYQNTLILLFTLPTLVAWQGSDQTLGWADGFLTLAFLILLYLETRADQQQYEFQEEKYRRIREGLPLGTYEKGFCDTGLWGKVRHPNYAAEQAIWLVFYLFSVAATGRWVNWSMTGVILLMLLFIGSSDFSEKISAEKYPAYKGYQQDRPRFWPRFF